MFSILFLEKKNPRNNYFKELFSLFLNFILKAKKYEIYCYIFYFTVKYEFLNF